MKQRNHVLQSLAKCFIQLGLTEAESATDTSIQNKILGSGYDTINNFE